MSALLTEFRTRPTTGVRKAVLTLVEMSWEGQEGTLRTATACMEDTSTGGARLRGKIPIVVGSQVGIRWHHDHFSGVVRYCLADGREYLMGVERDATIRPILNRLRQKGESALSNDPTPRGVTGLLASAPKINLPAQRRDFDALLRARIHPKAVPEMRTESRTVVDSEPRSELHPEIQAQRIEPQIKEPALQAEQGRKSMASKWLELPWRKKKEKEKDKEPDQGSEKEQKNVEAQESANASATGNSEAASDGYSNGGSKSAKENFMSLPAQPSPKPVLRSAREVPSFQVDLSSMEDIYRAAGIMSPKRGYSVNKVVEMLHSQYIRDSSSEVKRAAVLMALDAAGTPMEQVQRDAKARQDALDAHEAQQRKQVEAEWARKANEVIQIQAELESIKAHYMSRIERNMEGVAREKATFAGWVAVKQQECKSMAEALEMCLKSSGSETASSTPSEGSLKAMAKTV